MENNKKFYSGISPDTKGNFKMIKVESGRLRKVKGKEYPFITASFEIGLNENCEILTPFIPLDKLTLKEMLQEKTKEELIQMVIKGKENEEFYEQRVLPEMMANIKRKCMESKF